jgi:hypothetical protein
MIKKKTGKRGGARPGSGPKRKLEGGSGRMVYLDSKTVNILTALGDGNLSAGIRKAGELSKLHPGELYSKFTKSRRKESTDYLRGVVNFAEFLLTEYHKAIGKEPS